ncbi:MAG: UDP-3-O-acyl-N-acetylglucosamine deacetylase, partial [Hormoscilla sp.]
QLWSKPVDRTSHTPVAGSPQTPLRKGGFRNPPLLEGGVWGGSSPTTFDHTRAQVQIAEPVWVQRDDAFVCAMPASKTRFTYGIDFSVPAIGNQWHSWEPVSEDFATEIAPARTFGLADQIQQLRDRGLIKGGTLDNALVCSAEGWLNPPLRFANEPVRHKLLDLIGDMSLLGTIPVAHYLAYKASHQLHVKLAQKICQSN